MKHLPFIFLLLIACNPQVKEKPKSPPVPNPAERLDAWHEAAAEGAYETYFSFFEDSASVFIGTDATERWTLKEFAPWAKPAFEDGMAWDFKAFNRTLYFSSDSSLAWFDEELNTAKMGVLRGSGVLKLVEGEWRIAHYNLAVPIPNEIVYEVIEQAEASLERAEAE